MADILDAAQVTQPPPEPPPVPPSLPEEIKPPSYDKPKNKKLSPAVVIIGILFFVISLPLIVIFVSQPKMLADIRSRAFKAGDSGTKNVGGGKHDSTKEPPEKPNAPAPTATPTPRPPTPTPTPVPPTVTPTPGSPTPTPTPVPPTATPTSTPTPTPVQQIAYVNPTPTPIQQIVYVNPTSPPTQEGPITPKPTPKTPVSGGPTVLGASVIGIGMLILILGLTL